MSGQNETPLDLTNEPFTVKVHGKKRYKFMGLTKPMATIPSTTTVDVEHRAPNIDEHNNNNSSTNKNNNTNTNNAVVAPAPASAPTVVVPPLTGKPRSSVVPSTPEPAKEVVERVAKRKSKKTPEPPISESPLLRGKHGLRPLPQQVDYYQSILEDKKTTKVKSELTVKPLRSDDEFEDYEGTSKRARRSTVAASSAGPTTSTDSKRKSTKTNDKLTSPDSSVEHFGFGEIVWATLPSYKTWFPGLIISHLHCGQKPARAGHTWVYWFGDHQVSEIPKLKVKSFIANFNYFSKGTSSLTSIRMKEALQVLASRAGMDLTSDPGAAGDEEDAHVNWAKNGFRVPPEKEKQGHPFAPDAINPIPALAACYLPLDAMQQESLKTDDRLQQIAFYEVESAENEPEPDEPIQIPEFKQSQVERIKKGEMKLTDICIACCCDHNVVADIINGDKIQHPLFEGLLCKQCNETIKCTMYAPGEDNKNSFCAICGQVGNLAVCDNSNCHRVFCFVCIDLYVGPEAKAKIVDAQTWECYICNDSTIPYSSLLKRRCNWRENVKMMYDPIRLLTIHGRLFPTYANSKPIRVLSLCDGVASVYIALKNLKIDIQSFYVSEIDKDASSVTKFHNGDVIGLDRIDHLTPAKIASLCPIDFVVGGSTGSSSNQSSRKNIFDTKNGGHHFLYFNHILNLIRSFNKENHVFFLYENLATILNPFRDIVSDLLMCKPFTLNSKISSVQTKSRYFWSNIPGINRPIPTKLANCFFTLNNSPTAEVKQVILESAESSSFSKFGDIDGKDNLDPKDMEKLLGLSENYTDVNGLSRTKRQTVLGKTWSVPITNHILWALCDFFKSEK